MERLRTLTSLVYMLSVLFALELAFLIHLVRPRGTATWITIGAIAVVMLYLARLSLGALGELRELKKKGD